MLKKLLFGAAALLAVATGLFVGGCGDETNHKVTIKGATH